MDEATLIFPDLPEPQAGNRGTLAVSPMLQPGDPVVDMAQSLRNIEALLIHMVSGTRMSIDQGIDEVEDAKPTKQGARSPK